MNIENTLWVERYRPQHLSEYVFSDARQKQQYENWILNQDIPHLLFCGSPGVGKTAAACMLVNELHINPYDILFINASRENNVDNMRNKITSFASTLPYGKLKIIILDESDLLSFQSQAILRGVLEQFSVTTRFILTCNYSNKILPAIHSRCQTVHITKLDITDFTTRVAEILLKENIKFDLDTLDDYVKGTWPDLRKCINSCQQNSINGELLKPTHQDINNKDYKIEAVELFKLGKIKQARQLICSQIHPDEVESFFRFCYDNLDLWGNTDEQKDNAILIIKKAMVQIALCADAEILVAATLIELTQYLIKEK
jgi:replication factor C small subunit